MLTVGNVTFLASTTTVHAEEVEIKLLGLEHGAEPPGVTMMSPTCGGAVPLVESAQSRM